MARSVTAEPCSGRPDSATFPLSRSGRGGWERGPGGEVSKWQRACFCYPGMAPSRVGARGGTFAAPSAGCPESRTSMKRLPKIVPALFLAVLLFPSLGGSVEGPPANEEFRYRWQLRNFMGAVAGLFFPRQGEGSLTFMRTNGHLKSELTITSPQSKEEGYFRYGSEIDVRTLQPIRAWSAYSWRGESKSKNEAVSK